MMMDELCSLASEHDGELGGVQPSRFVARQPILDVHSKVVGYELLFRSGWENCFRGDADGSTRQMLDNVLCMGIDALAERKLAFINCTREALVGRLVTLLPFRTAVLEILESVEPDAEVMEACEELRNMGYLLALDDFMPRENMQPLVDIVNYVKVDFRLGMRGYGGRSTG